MSTKKLSSLTGAEIAVLVVLSIPAIIGSFFRGSK